MKSNEKSSKKHERFTGSDTRIRALLDGEKVDRVPLFLFALGFCAKTVGYSLHDIYSGAEKSFLAQVRTAEMYGCQALPRFGISLGAAEFGGELSLPDSEWDQSPSVKRYAVQSEEDIEKLESLDVENAGLRSINMQVAQLVEGHGLPVIPFHNGSPFSRAGNVCGVDTLCRWMLKKPKVVHRLLRLFTDRMREVARHWTSVLPPERLLPFMAMPVESNQVISPRHFVEFALPYLKELNKEMLLMGIKHIHCHVCGEQNGNLPYLSEIPWGDPGIASFGHEVDLARAIEYLGEKVIIAGNINPIDIQMGTPQEIYERATQCIDKAKHAPRGYLMMPGCEMAPLAPPYNVYMLKKAIDDFGWYE